MDGRIVSIKVQNFMTYDYVEFYPGMNLNVVIGPNGTGKSSLVCAMVLGLKSRPHLLARGSSVASFVRGLRGTSTIEVELLNSRGENHLIKRVISAESGNSSWYLNNMPSQVKDVENLVTKLNIQVDNLCQFLPQDRVQDFARMNQQDLLENTIRCVGKQQLLDDWQKLKDLRERDKSMHNDVKSLSESIRTKESQNSSIETDIRSLRKRKTLEQQLLTLKQKHGWLVYAEKKKTLDKVSVRINELKKECSACEKSSAAVKRMHEKVMVKMKALQNKYNEENAAAEEKASAVRNTCQSLNKAEDVIEDERQVMEGRIQMAEQREKEMTKLASDIGNVVSQLEAARKELGNTDFSAEVKELGRRNMRKIEEKKVLMQEEQQILGTLQMHSYEAKALENERARLLDVKNQRLELLRNKYPDAVTAVKWLRENQKRFQYPVYEPIMTLIDPTSASGARYLESIIAHRDLVAFVFEDAGDMSTFLLEMREGKGLNVNAVQSDGRPRKFEPNVPLSAISSYGFTLYTSSLFTTVPAINNYLCETYNLHNIPIGNDRTYQMLDEVPSHIKFFFTLDKRITRKTSRYSNNSTTLMGSLGEARFLNICADTSKLAAAEKGLEKARAAVAALEQKRAAVQQELSAVERDQEKLLMQKKTLEARLSETSSLEARVRTMRETYKRQAEQWQDPDRVREAFRGKFKAVLADMRQRYGQMAAAVTQAQQCWVACRLTQLQLESLRDVATHVENKLREEQRQLSRSQEALRQAVRDVEGVKDDVKSAMAAAKRLTDGLTPQSDGFGPFRKAFQSLTDDLESLESDMEVIRGKLDCLVGADSSVLVEFENRKKQIEDLKAQLEAKTNSSVTIKSSMNEVKKEWLGSLNELVENISRKFSDCFATLKCAGEVKLQTGTNEDDFDQYGLRVRVKFRSEDELQDLNKHLQSGGERSVSTAVFMISLQGLTRVPFCCVDEINQGMDKFNERMIFDLLVATTSLPNSPQYFLLTPKLLSGLQYSPTTVVSCVFNGSWIAPCLVTRDHGKHSKKRPRLT
ncbi:LOW QUALITY PROTEIN: structural maintenance of chromosomes protein 5 [Bacillus rossius redtenbacheri]|uniref:LOW QUALITY PROTEIN: structural maintenance of chromosomes protein 5 n=1 Tax=Bacillus rossius redtenbacheri TaxID=93214 RepID=UPI002FDEB4A6